MKSIAILLFAALAACGGTIGDDDGGTDSGVDAKSDAPPCDKCVDGGVDGDQPYACGDNFCFGQQICIHGCCGGAQICAPLEDGGGCPSGLSISQQCPPEAPCSDTCTPPPPYCGTTSECTMPTQGRDCYLLCY